MAFSHAFLDFGCPPKLKKEAILELPSAFFEVRDFDDFLSLRSKGPAEEGVPPMCSLCSQCGCYPITACSPTARGAPNLKGYALCRRFLGPETQKIVEISDLEKSARELQNGVLLEPRRAPEIVKSVRKRHPRAPSDPLRK